MSSLTEQNSDTGGVGSDEVMIVQASAHPEFLNFMLLS